MRRSMIIVLVSMILITLLAAVLYIYSRYSVRQLEQQNVQSRSYEKQYALVSSDQSELWQAIYRAASEQAEQENVYLEWIGKDAPVDYTTEDCMKIATASKVDGILLYPEESGATVELISAAERRGIPVITILRDETDSSRVSYIGVNSYRMGELYGKQVLQCLKDKLNRIVVLTDKLTDDGNTNLLYSQMLQTIESGNNRNHEYEITLVQVDTTTSFDAEEDIRDLFMVQENVPDILICLDLISTECVIQALVDYNEVGKITVIGTYASETVYDALEKGILYSSINVDTNEIGQLGISSMNEYKNLGYVSNYFNLGLEIINQKNVGRKRNENH